MIKEMRRGESIPGSVNGFHYFAQVISKQPANYFTQRVIAAHPEAVIPAEMNLIYWWPA
jgi:hypothetical protein